jgi:hypothetical protein
VTESEVAERGLDLVFSGDKFFGGLDMRKLALVAFVLSAAPVGFVGCGDSSPRKVNNGTAGAGGSSGTAGSEPGTAGNSPGTAGDIGTAGAGTAGADAAAGVSGTAGAVAGTDGGADVPVSGTAGAPVEPCDTKPNKALPYAIEADFSVAHVLTNGSVSSWTNVANPTCDATTFPAFPVLTSDGGADGATEAGSEAGTTDGGVADAAADGSDATLTLQLTDPDAGTADAADGSTADGGADGATTEAGSDGAVIAEAGAEGGSDASGDGAASNVPACYEFAYDPDACVASGSPTCWSGVIFQTSDTDLRAAGPGVCIAQGAMKVTFMARSSRDSANVKFGSIAEGVGVTEYYLHLTTAWAPYSIVIPAGLSYDTSSTDPGAGVWNGFSVVTEPEDHVGGTYIFVKDIQWVAQ